MNYVQRSGILYTLLAVSRAGLSIYYTTRTAIYQLEIEAAVEKSGGKNKHARADYISCVPSCVFDFFIQRLGSQSALTLFLFFPSPAFDTVPRRLFLVAGYCGAGVLDDDLPGSDHVERPSWWS